MPHSGRTKSTFLLLKYTVAQTQSTYIQIESVRSEVMSHDTGPGFCPHTSLAYKQCQTQGIQYGK